MMDLVFDKLKSIVSRTKKKPMKELYFVTVEFTKLAEELIVGGDYAKVIVERLYRNGHIYTIKRNCYYDALIKSFHRRDVPVIDMTISGIPLRNTEMPKSQVILGHIGYEG